MKRITANQYQTSERYYKLPKILFEDEKYMDYETRSKGGLFYFKRSFRIISQSWLDR